MDVVTKKSTHLRESNMSITITEQLLPLSDAARLVPRRNGRTAHFSSIYRWTTNGCHGVVLESLQCGATRCTSREALGRFFAALSAAAGLREPTTAGRRASEMPIEKKLDELGL